MQAQGHNQKLRLPVAGWPASVLGYTACAVYSRRVITHYAFVRDPGHRVICQRMWSRMYGFLDTGNDGSHGNARLDKPSSSPLIKFLDVPQESLDRRQHYRPRQLCREQITVLIDLILSGLYYVCWYNSIQGLSAYKPCTYPQGYLTTRKRRQVHKHYSYNYERRTLL